MQPFGVITSTAYAGIDGVIIYFEQTSLLKANEEVQAYFQALKSQQYPWLKELLPAYDSLLIIFDIEQVDSHYVYQILRQTEAENSGVSQNQNGVHHRLPVWYEAPEANDFAKISSLTGLTHSQIIRLHSEQQYRVYTVGFAPGFAYMGDTDVALTCPRLETPRKRVPKGAVAIADRQTAVYPQASPGGWNLLGLCPVSLFDVAVTPPGKLNAGDTVTFYPVSEEKYRELLNDNG
ncbi:carboxyltransferase domain-containing protein [Alteromonas pelagimontana]|uniref:Carboxyltransferase domain-containing protein n=1 Tax=Alteromonas pelagimontana TaxID=1858656 RepID=A0A6M4MB93_9ALTE|nr:allophanate hydrolase subunit 1 [Alteromonas pelagimontana]QJR79426.1 carboxyltransferase domain-containing protein [Alteromonas pelagimontana]